MHSQNVPHIPLCSFYYLHRLFKYLNMDLALAAPSKFVIVITMHIYLDTSNFSRFTYCNSQCLPN